MPANIKYNARGHAFKNILLQSNVKLEFPTYERSQESNYSKKQELPTSAVAFDQGGQLPIHYLIFRKLKNFQTSVNPKSNGFYCLVAN